MLQNNKHQKKRKVVITLTYTFLVVCLMLIGYFVLHISNSDSTQANQNSDNVTNLEPATAQEKQAAESAKDAIVDDQRQATKSTSNNTKNVNVVVVDAGQYDNAIEVRSYAEGLYDNASCTITFTKDGLVFTKQTPAFPDASTTICTNPTIERSDFPQLGEWELKISFDSAQATGVSAPQSITIR